MKKLLFAFSVLFVFSSKIMYSSAAEAHFNNVITTLKVLGDNLSTCWSAVKLSLTH